jgi:hypothetical protein
MLAELVQKDAIRTSVFHVRRHRGHDGRLAADRGEIG